MKICRTIVAISIAFLILCGLQGCSKTNKNGVLVTVTSMVPNRGGTGTVVTITGTGFYSDITQETVSVELLNANIISATATQIVFSVPMVSDSATLDSSFVLVTVQNQAVVKAGTFYFNIVTPVNTDVSTLPEAALAAVQMGWVRARRSRIRKMVFLTNPGTCMWQTMGIMRSGKSHLRGP